VKKGSHFFKALKAFLLPKEIVPETGVYFFVAFRETGR